MDRQEKKSSAVGINRWDVAAAGSFLLLLVALGCNKEEKSISATNSDAPSAGVMATPAATTAGGRGTTTSAVTAGAIVNSAPREEASGQTPSAEQELTLPPEIVASSPDSLVVPGSIVEITAEGSPDVTEVILSDGRGQSRPFVFDAAANVWRASYRVPLRSLTERVALSATATNGGSQWKRVWIFLNVLPKQTAAGADGDGC
jgi:hypothetical protein